MTAGNEKSTKQLEWEPPRLMRLTAPGDAWAAPCTIFGSGAVEGCTIGTNPTGICTNGNTLGG